MLTTLYPSRNSHALVGEWLASWKKTESAPVEAPCKATAALKGWIEDTLHTGAENEFIKVLEKLPQEDADKLRRVIARHVLTRHYVEKGVKQTCALIAWPVSINLHADAVFRPPTRTALHAAFTESTALIGTSARTKHITAIISDIMPLDFMNALTPDAAVGINRQAYRALTDSAKTGKLDTIVKLTHEPIEPIRIAGRSFYQGFFLSAVIWRHGMPPPPVLAGTFFGENDGRWRDRLGEMIGFRLAESAEHHVRVSVNAGLSMSNLLELGCKASILPLYELAIPATIARGYEQRKFEIGTVDYGDRYELMVEYRARNANKEFIIETRSSSTPFQIGGLAADIAAFAGTSEQHGVTSKVAYRGIGAFRGTSATRNSS